MELDFTRLNSLAFIAPKKPSETLKGEGEYKTPIEVKKPVETLTEGLEGINKLQKILAESPRLQSLGWRLIKYLTPI